MSFKTLNEEFYLKLRRGTKVKSLTDGAVGHVTSSKGEYVYIKSEDTRFSRSSKYHALEIEICKQKDGVTNEY